MNCRKAYRKAQQGGVDLYPSRWSTEPKGAPESTRSALLSALTGMKPRQLYLHITDSGGRAYGYVRGSSRDLAVRMDLIHEGGNHGYTRRAVMAEVVTRELTQVSAEILSRKVEGISMRELLLRQTAPERTWAPDLLSVRRQNMHTPPAAAAWEER